MPDVLSACADFFKGVTQAGYALVDVVLGLLEFNFHVVSSVLVFIYNGSLVIATIAQSFGYALLEIGKYMFDGLWQVLVFLYGFAHILGDALAVLELIFCYLLDGVIYVISGIAYAIVKVVYSVSSVSSYIGRFVAEKVHLKGVWPAIAGVPYKCASVIKHYWHACTDYVSQSVSSAYTAVIGTLAACMNGVYLNTTKELMIYFALFIVSMYSISWLLSHLNKRGLTLPFFLHQRSRRPRNWDPHAWRDGDVFSSDSSAENSEEENFSNESADEDEEDEDEDEVEDVEEYEVVTDSETDSLPEEEEEEIEVIDIQIPPQGIRYNLRNRPSPPPEMSDKLTPQDLEKILDNERERRVCVVCQDQLKTVLVLPCRHMCLCCDCAREIVAQRNAARRVCPLCRARMETVMNVFIWPDRELNF